MVGVYLGLVAVWLWFCLVFTSRPARMAVLLPILIPWCTFVWFGRQFFEWLEEGTIDRVNALGRWLDGVGKQNRGAK